MATHAQVAHAWAHQTGRTRKGPNMYYEGATIYSYGYHFPIARIIDIQDRIVDIQDRADGDRADERGRGRGRGRAGKTSVCLFTTRSYGKATAKHKNRVWSAVYGVMPILNVVDPTSTNYALSHEASIESAHACVDKARRARTCADSYLEAARRHLENADSLNIYFGLGLPVATLRETLGVSFAEQAERQAASQRERRVASQRERREAWLIGANNGFHGVDEQGRAYLRIVGDQVQTSRGVRVPLDRAIQIFDLMRMARDTGEGWLPSEPFKIGPYEVDYIQADGTLKAGCHTISLSEGERVWTSIVAEHLAKDKNEGVA